jgi:hypothetical protein
LRTLVTRALNEDPRHRPTAHELLELLLTAGTAGNSHIRAGLHRRPELQRAAGAVRRTVRLAVTAEHGNRTPARSGLATLVQQPLHGRRWLSPSAAAVVTAIALAAGFGLFPLAHRAITSNIDVANSPSREPDIDTRVEASSDPASRGGSRAGCTLDGPLEVTPQTPKAFTCPASNTPTHQAIDAQVKLGTRDACAAIWTHVVNGKGYRITVCTEHLSLDIDNNGHARTIAFAELDPPADPAIWHRVQVLTPGTGISVDIDGERAVTDRAHHRRSPEAPSLSDSCHTPTGPTACATPE